MATNIKDIIFLNLITFLIIVFSDFNVDLTATGVQ